jgi:hypothetical protein
VPDSQQNLTEQEANDLCLAATAVFFAVVRLESMRRGGPIRLPALLCPKTEPPCPCTLDPDLVVAAEQFLLRLGVIHFDEHDRPRLSFL